MRISRLLGFIFLMTPYLSSCAAPVVTVESSPVTLVTSPTRTPFLPVSDTPVPPSETPTESPTPTESSTPTDPATITPTSTATPSLRVNLEAVGDMMLARTIGDRVLAKGPEIVFAGVQSVLDAADALVGNLECAITTRGEPQIKSFTFAAPPETTKALALAGFDVVSLANNHAMDYGSDGLFDTRDNLEKFGIASVGTGANASEAHAPAILVKNGLRLAFLAYADVPPENAGFDAREWIASASQPGIAWADINQMKNDIAAAKQQADLVIVMLHAGNEITAVISSINYDQRLEARAAIDAGAALVIGSHPHVLQQIERYHGGLIAYSLGNFVFDKYNGVANATIILSVILTPAGVQSYDWVPVLIENGLPRVAAKGEAPAIATLVAPMNP